MVQARPRARHLLLPPTLLRFRQFDLIQMRCALQATKRRFFAEKFAERIVGKCAERCAEKFADKFANTFADMFLNMFAFCGPA